jgi:hypothetical protein
MQRSLTLVVLAAELEWTDLVPVGALVFTVASFWWIWLRRGRLTAVTSSELRIRFPLVIYNTGTRAIVIENLRLVVEGHELDGSASAVRSGRCPRTCSTSLRRSTCRGGRPARSSPSSARAPVVATRAWRVVSRTDRAQGPRPMGDPRRVRVVGAEE